MSGADYRNSAGDDDYDLGYDPPTPAQAVRRSLRMFMGIAAVLVVLAGAGVVGAVVLRGKLRPPPPARTPCGSSPRPDAGGKPLRLPGRHGPAGGRRSATGGERLRGHRRPSTPATSAAPSCDGQKLVAALQADGDRAAAWAAAENIQAADIPVFVSGLTPVVLRADTSVTAFGYDDPSFFSYPAVLQAGTAVFINARGEPGQVLHGTVPSRAQPAPTVARTVSYVGPRWTTFRTTSVTVVRPSTTINKVFCFGGTGVGGAGGAGGTVPQPA